MTKELQSSKRNCFPDSFLQQPQAFLYLCAYSFLAVLGLCCRVGFLQVQQGGHSGAAVRALLSAVASLAVELVI